MQSFTKLVDKVGDPPAPLPAPAAIPPPGPGVQAWGAPLEVPSLQEVGFTDTPTTIFKVRHIRNTPPPRVDSPAHRRAL